MVRRASDRSFNAKSMEEFDETEVIRASELQENEDQADLKFLSGENYRLVPTTSKLLEKFASMEAKMDVNFTEIQKTLSQLCNQLGIHPIEADSSQHVPPVTNFSDPYVHDDVNRLSLDNRKNLSHKIEMPKFDGSNAYEWLSKVERFFHVGRYSDCDKLNLVSLSLEGDALKWFNWQLIRREFRSWEDFRRRLFRKFGAAPEEASRNRLFEELSAQVIEQQTVHKEESITHIQVIGLDESHLEHLFAPGLQTEMKEVLKLKEPMVLENNKPAVLRRETGSFCQLFSEETSKPWGNQQSFTSKPVASVHFLSFEVGTAETMSSGLSQHRQVWEPGGVLASVNVADSLGEKASYTEKKLLLQYQTMDSTNGNGVDVEAANGAHAANGGGDIDALPPPPPILPPNVEPLHVKTEPVERKNLRVPMARTGIGTKGQKIPLLTNLQGHFYHSSVALFSDDDRPVEAKGIRRKILDKVHEPYHSDLVGKAFAYDGEETLFPYGVLPDNKMDFAVVLEVVSAARTTGNASPNGNENDGTTSIWHRWRRKDCTRTSNCVLPLQFSFFKLEDKLIFGEGSIDTLHQTYYRKKKLNQVPIQELAVAHGE